MGKDLNLHKMRKSISFMSTNIDIEIKGTRYGVVTCFIALLNVPYSRVLLIRKITFSRVLLIRKLTFSRVLLIRKLTFSRMLLIRKLTFCQKVTVHKD